MPRALDPGASARVATGYRFPGLTLGARRAAPYRSGRSPDRLKMKNPDAPAVKREAEEKRIRANARGRDGGISEELAQNVSVFGQTGHRADTVRQRTSPRATSAASRRNDSVKYFTHGFRKGSKVAKTP